MRGSFQTFAGKFLSLPSAIPQDGDQIIQSDVSDVTEASSTFDIVWGGVTADVYRIGVPVDDANRCLDVKDASQEDGAPIILWGCGDGANQQFKMVKVA